MIKSYIFLIFCFSINVYASHHEVDISKDEVKIDSDLSYFASIRLLQMQNDFNHLLSITQNSFEGRNVKDITIGSRYRLFNKLKIGLFYSNKTGLIHDNDLNLQEDGSWHWLDTNSRNESEIIAEISPRSLINFLPGQNWVGEVRIRYKKNIFDDEDSLIMRPGLTYFSFYKGKPLFNFFIQYEKHYALNFGVDKNREDWFYLGLMYHLNKNIKLGLTYSIYQMIWEAPDQFVEMEGFRYKEIESGSQVGIFINFMNLF